MKQKIGKVSPETLEKNVFPYCRHHRNLIIPPRIGEDAAVIKTTSNYIAISSDPITGADEKIGWLCIHVNANDIAVSGAKPLWAVINLLVPLKTTGNKIREIMKEAGRAAEEIKVNIVGGHTERTRIVKKPVIIGTMIGEIKRKPFSSSTSNEGDLIIMTKSAGIEGTAIIASSLKKRLSKKLDNQLIGKAEKLMEKISVLKEAMLLAAEEGVTAMHDPTEGGIINGVWEICEASGKGAIIYEEKINVTEETKKICETLKIDPLKLISSGCLLATIRPEKAGKIVKLLEKNKVKASVIGEITNLYKGRKIVRLNGSQEKLQYVQDEIWRIHEES